VVAGIARGQPLDARFDPSLALSVFQAVKPSVESLGALNLHALIVLRKRQIRKGSA
jgi:hypothetical protein